MILDLKDGAKLGARSPRQPWRNPPARSELLEVGAHREHPWLGRAAVSLPGGFHERMERIHR